MKIIIGADFIPTESNESYFCNADLEYLIGEELINVLQVADYRIFNLELPLTSSNTPIKKCGPNLSANMNCVNLYKKIPVDLFTLANNHIMDQGIGGLNDTVNTLKSNDIAYLGVGDNIDESRKPYIIKIDGVVIGVYACTENEFSVAKKECPGANPFDPFICYEDINSLKAECDYVIVLYHGGKEHFRYPSPVLQSTCRRFIDKGADLVICQHSHCVGCEEKYKEGTIVYGQGNFLFDYNKSEFWKTGMLIEVDGKEVRYIPIVKRHNTVRKASEKESETIIKDFMNRSEEIKNKNFIENNYVSFSSEILNGILCNILGVANNIVFRIINKLTRYRFAKFYLRIKYNDKKRLRLLNCIKCEAHREVIITALEAELESRQE